MKSRYHQRFLTEEERFFSWVEKTENCWLWQGALDKDGYGHFRLGNRRNIRAHHYLFGQIPEGKQLDHLCRVRNCVRREHLEAVTCKENLYRSPITAAFLRSSQTKCKRNHEYSEGNLIVDSRGFRHCRKCKNLVDNRRRRLKAALLAETED